LNLLVSGSPSFSVNYTLNGVSQELAGVSTTLIPLSNSPGVYVLDSLSDAFCTNSISGTQTINLADAPIVPEILGSSEICINSTLPPLTILNVSAGIRWYADAALTIYLGDYSELLPSNQTTQTYYATQTWNNCESLPDSFTVTVIQCAIDIPTAFTPNQDGVNDVWTISGLDTQYPKNKVKIFNRWGELLFESLPGTYSSKPWDGSYKSSMLPVASYYYVIDLSDDGSLDPLNGIVSIILKK
jgi:gliding motility-associated-like protein